MLTTLTRRLVAAIASAGLLLVAAPTMAPASAADACALGATCDAALSGSLGVSPVQIRMPAKFNGTVLLYSHGYRFSGPIPAAFAGPTALGLTADPYYTAASIPAFAASFGTPAVYQANNKAEVAPSDTAAAALLAQGYALAGAGYANQGWAAAEGVQAGENLIKYINGGAISGVKGIRAWGPSLGGLISQTLAERNPGKIAGVLPLCGVVAGPEQAFSTAMTLLFTWKTLIAPTMRVANYQSYPQALGDLATVLTTLGGVAAGTVSTSAVGYPVAQANLLGGLMGGLPTKSSVYDGQTVNPAFATMSMLAALGGGYMPASAGANSAVAMLQNSGYAAALGILGRYDLEQRARTIAGIPATETANFNDNTMVSYTNLLSPEQRGEFGDTLNASTVKEHLMEDMLVTLDASKGNVAVRFPASAKAIAAIRALPAPKGIYGVPTVLMSTTYDPAVPAGNTGWLSDRLAASYQKAGKGGVYQVSTFYTVPPADGWTRFEPGGKSASAALSLAALGGSGVGHCVFTGPQMLGAVATLGKVVNAKTAGQMKAANRAFWTVVGVNGDGAYMPDPLKRPNAK